MEVLLNRGRDSSGPLGPFICSPSTSSPLRMPFEEFSRRFDRIDVCDRSSHHDLRLDVHEDEGLLGVCKGCFFGCSSFWFLCRGIRTIYCGHRTSTDVEYQKPVCNCGRERGRAWTDTAIV